VSPYDIKKKNFFRKITLRKIEIVTKRAPAAYFKISEKGWTTAGLVPHRRYCRGIPSQNC